MFAMTIYRLVGLEKGPILASGESRDGEGWEDALKRIFGENIGYARDYSALPATSPTHINGLPRFTMATMAGPPGGLMHVAYEILVETDPPQNTSTG
jgi:hypothetical protein